MPNHQYQMFHPQLIVTNLSKRYGRRRLFRRMSFTLDGGGTLAVTGANGSGKSTLLKILAGVTAATKGEVVLSNGTPIAQEERPFHAGLVAPYLNVYDGLSARENLAFIARVRRYTQAEDRIAELLEQVGLAQRGDDLVSTFSSGMKQRVKIAAAILADPVLLLLDEPTTNLDDAGRALVEQVVAHQREAGRLLILATNDPTEVKLCTRTLHIEDFS